MDYYKKALQMYAVFEGRSTRREYWMFVLFNLIISVIVALVSSFLGTRVLSDLYGLIVVIPGLAIGARRLHDTGRSGWWLLIGIIPLIGWIVLIVFFAESSEAKDNIYGHISKDAAPKFS